MSAPTDQIELDRAAIAAQQQVWLAARPAAFEYRVEVECDCARAGTFRVTVEGDEIIDVEYGSDAEPYRVHSPPTPDHTFSVLDEALALAESGEISIGRASASFHPTFGHAVSWTVTGSDGLPSHRAEIHDFRPLDPATITRPPQGLEVVVSNQSFEDPAVDLTLTIDEEVIVDRSFDVGSQHTYLSYRIPLEPGEHHLTISADTGATHERTVTFGPQRHYVYVAYLGGVTPPQGAFSVDERDQPFSFG